jgi:phenylalanyl-tRNA synthetase beta chain
VKFSENWLREHVEVAASRDELVTRLTLIGLEVEDVTAIGGALEGVVVAQILQCARHPEADRLQVCSVDAALAQPLQIVCGAPNARPGLKAPLAMIGATLPGGMAIKAANLRGVESSGMLCSAKELGLDLDASGLLELPADAMVGAALAEVLGLPDASIEIKLTPNRADCFSVRGIAFDVAAACGTHVHPHDIAVVSPGIATQLAVALDADGGCPRYCGRLIEGTDARAATPSWMRERLKRSGLRPISLLVDVTAYVMLELGQPMHAYDADKLLGSIGVRHANAGERLKLLDEREVVLDPEFMVITDDSGSIGLAGIMGGFDTRVTDATGNVFLEAAHFAPAAIAGRARRLGMHTDASQRFERGVDPQLPRQALEYATSLILRIAGGKPGPISEAVLPAHLPIRPTVTLRRGRLSRVLGVHIGDAEVERILRALGMHVEGYSHGWTVTPPSRRFDIAIEEDLIEEIARIHGYERIPTAMPSGEIRAVTVTESRVPDSDIRRQLAACDYLEAINYAFVDAAVLAQWNLDANAVELANPLSSELGVMRTALLPGLVEALRRNRTRQQERVRLFEIGRVFGFQEGSAPLETPRVAAVASGRADAEQWGEPARAVDFHDVKADLEGLAALAGIDPADLRFTPVEAAWLHPGRSAAVWRDDLPLGWIGHLHPGLLKRLDIDTDVVCFELDLERLTVRAIPHAAELSRFPLVRRDLALVVPESTPWAALEASLKGTLGRLLRDLRLFDVYHGPGLEAGTKSLAMGLILQDVSRTLTDHDADRAVADAVAALQRDCGAQLR